MKRFLIAASAVFSASMAHGQAPNCLPATVVQDRLANDFGEERIGSGLSRGNVVSLWHNPQTGSWTVIISLPNGLACFAAAGEEWSVLPSGVRS